MFCIPTWLSAMKSTLAQTTTDGATGSWCTLTLKFKLNFFGIFSGLFSYHSHNPFEFSIIVPLRYIFLFPSLLSLSLSLCSLWLMSIWPECTSLNGNVLFDPKEEIMNNTETFRMHCAIVLKYLISKKVTQYSSGCERYFSFVRSFFCFVKCFFQAWTWALSRTRPLIPCEQTSTAPLSQCLRSLQQNTFW